MNGVVRVNNKIVYSIIVPLYNEELVIGESYKRLKKVMDITKENYEIIFVNDGSKDRTRIMVEEICYSNASIKLINFSRNFGHQAAITAGMEKASGEAIVVIDADLQDPPEVILEMIDKWKLGYKVVYGKRTKREGESWFKKTTALVFYRLLKSMTTIDIPVDAGDFRLIDRKVCDDLMKLPEKNRYVRGLISWIGYSQTYVEFTRKERFAGKTKYNLKKMLKLAFDGITGFSSKPLMLSNYLGGLSFFIGAVTILIDIIGSIVNQSSIMNLPMILGINLVMFGLVFFTVGIMGQYIARIFDESKDRPLYIIDSYVDGKEMKKKYEIFS